MFYPIAHPMLFLRGIGALDIPNKSLLVHQFEHHAQVDPAKVFLRFEDQQYTYSEANEIVNRHAHAYRELGIRHGDVVALIIENRPEFLFHLLGLHKLGAVGSLINTHLIGDSLAHALQVCQPRHVVVSTELWPAFADIRHRVDVPDSAIDVDVDSVRTDTASGSKWQARLVGVSKDSPVPDVPLSAHDQAAYIYTSGTTGLPKAAVMTQARLFRAATVWAGLSFRYRARDVLYNCLPLYHSNGLMLASGSAISAGITLALGRKFSRSQFWADIRRHDASAFMYIGELCRYLMNNPPAPSDREHRVRVISGNGMRPDIWRHFQERFGVRRVAEFYGSTEGNCITINTSDVVGSVGLKLPGMQLVRWDDDADDFARDTKGHLIPVKPHEPGVLLGRIRRRAEFDGYRDKTASESKIVRSAFVTGDAWFNTGDLLRVDHRGELFFVDRLGDTFRWKGENVATSEVQEVIATWEPVQEVNVYGVTVPGIEGRAGMAALVLAPGSHFDPEGLKRIITDGLPRYARPVFVRLLQALTTTSTFKLKKSELQDHGYDPRHLTDPLFLLHPKQDAYIPFTPELYDDITAGRLAL